MPRLICQHANVLAAPRCAPGPRLARSQFCPCAWARLPRCEAKPCLKQAYICNVCYNVPKTDNTVMLKALLISIMIKQSSFRPWSHSYSQAEVLQMNSRYRHLIWIMLVHLLLKNAHEYAERSLWSFTSWHDSMSIERSNSPSVVV